MVQIDPSARISPHAQLGRDIVVGPFCLIKSGAIVGDRCVLESHVVVETDTTLEKDNHIFQGAALGAAPQHVTAREPFGVLSIGAGNVVRENVTIHRALKPGNTTVVGEHNMIMACAHIAHDCQIGNHIVMCNNAMLAGHVTIHDRAFLSGAVLVHQFCRIGYLAMLGAGARVGKDVLPYLTVDGGYGHVVGLNLVGLRRAGFSASDVRDLKTAYRLVFRNGLSCEEILIRLEKQCFSGPAARFHEFISNSSRSFCRERLPKYENEEDGLRIVKIDKPSEPALFQPPTKRAA